MGRIISWLWGMRMCLRMLDVCAGCQGRLLQQVLPTSKVYEEHYTPLTHVHARPLITRKAGWSSSSWSWSWLARISNSVFPDASCQSVRQFSHTGTRNSTEILLRRTGTWSEWSSGPAFHPMEDSLISVRVQTDKIFGMYLNTCPYPIEWLEAMH